MSKSDIYKICSFAVIFSLVIPFGSSYAEELQNLKIEIKYTNGDRLDTWQAKYVIYQDHNTIPFLEQNLENNPDYIDLPKDHRYQVEVFVNGIFSEQGFIELQNEPENLDITIPLSGGVKFNVVFEDGETPVENATVIIKSNDGEEQRVGTTNEEGETMRYWLQSTVLEESYYITEVYYEDFLLTSVSDIKVHKNIYQDQKILVPIPAVVEELITFRLYDNESQKVLKSDGDFSILLLDQNGNPYKKTMMNNGDIYFSSIPSGVYSVSVLRDGIKDAQWEENNIGITGNQNKFEIFPMKEIDPISEPTTDPISEPTTDPIPEPTTDPIFEPIIYESTISEYTLSCNCVSFRFDDVQDYWLTDVQSEIINLFSKNNIPLTIGIIADEFGNDPKIVNVVKNAIQKNTIEIANHGLVHVPFTNFDKQEQSEMLQESSDKIYELLEVYPTIFIPPENKFNDDTKQALLDNGFTHMSASTIYDLPPFLSENDTFYRFPEITTTGGYVPSQERILGKTSDQTFSEAVDGINEYGFAVITMHPQEFSVFKGGQHTDELNLDQLQELRNLLDKINSENIEIIFLGKISHNMFKVNISETQENSSAEYVIPKWIKNNAGWWRDGHIDDNSFLHGIQFLIKEGIMEIPPTTQGIGGSEIPIWVKNNAGWWAEDRISDDDFIVGVNYLVNNGIIIIDI